MPVFEQGTKPVRSVAIVAAAENRERFGLRVDRREDPLLDVARPGCTLPMGDDDLASASSHIGHCVVFDIMRNTTTMEVPMEVSGPPSTQATSMETQPLAPSARHDRLAEVLRAAFD